MTSNAHGNGAAHGDADPDAATAPSAPEKVAHKTATPDNATRDKATGGTAILGNGMRDDATAGEATSDKSTRDATVRDKSTRDATVRDKSTRDATVRDATARDATARDATARDATARDATARDKGASGTGASGTGGSGTGTLDEAVLAELYRLHGGYLLRALIRIFNGDRGRAEDVLQETLVRAWRNPAAIAGGPAACRPWLFTVARRIAIDHFRRVAARPQEVSDEAPQDRTPAYDPYDDVLAARDIEVLLAKLPPHHRAVMVELHLNGRSVADAARVLGIPVGTVKSRNYYAVQALRPLLEAAGLRAAA